MPLSSDISTARAHYEIVVVGSGYGGAVAASRMARAFRDVCVLERGREIVAPDFPRGTLDILSQIQVDSPDGHRGPETGLYDFRSNPQVWAVVACGLGGGSLINAGVALRPKPAVFADPRWPAPLRLRPDGTLPRDLEDAYDLAERVFAPETWPDAEPLPARLHRMQEAGAALGVPLTKAPINVAFTDRTNPFHIEQKACTRCGDCVSGCNYGSKGTLATSYLADAWNFGAHLFTQVSVTHLTRPHHHDDDWVVHWIARDARGNPLREGFTRAGLVILAAGTFGSTEILLRSRRRGLALSSQVGTRFSANGDTFACSWGGKDPVYAIGRGTRPPDGPNLPGPTILGLLDLRDAPRPADQVAIEDGVVPGGLVPLSLVRLAEQVEARVKAGETSEADYARALGEAIGAESGDVPDEPPGEPDDQPPAHDAAEIRQALTQLDGLLGRAAPTTTTATATTTATRGPDVTLLPGEPTAGSIDPPDLAPLAGPPAPDNVDRIVGDARYTSALERTLPFLGMGRDDANGHLVLDPNGRVRVSWPGVSDEPNFAVAFGKLATAATALGGLYVPDPLTTPLMGRKQLTAHPLGGCPIGATGQGGAVDHLGRAFRGDGLETWDDLLVLDGSTLPVAAGINPLLTITALAERALCHLAAERGWPLDVDAPSPHRDPGRPPGIGGRFSERMEGWFRAGAVSFAESGDVPAAPLAQDLTISIDDVDRFLDEPGHEARMAGAVTCPALSPRPLLATRGTFNLFVPDPNDPRAKRIRYRMHLTSEEGRRWFFDGVKHIGDDPGFDLLKDNTTLYVTIHEGDDEQGPVAGRGVVTIGVAGIVRMLASVHVTNAPNAAAGLAAFGRFTAFYLGTLWSEYFKR